MTWISIFICLIAHVPACFNKKENHWKFFPFPNHPTFLSTITKRNVWNFTEEKSNFNSKNYSRAKLIKKWNSLCRSWSLKLSQMVTRSESFIKNNFFFLQQNKNSTNLWHSRDYALFFHLLVVGDPNGSSFSFSPDITQKIKHISKINIMTTLNVLDTPAEKYA